MGKLMCKNCRYKGCALCRTDHIIHAATCENYTPATHADRIRSFTDEELAEWAAERSTSPNCTGKCRKDYEVYGELRTFCHDCWLDWLKQEVENGETD